MTEPDEALLLAKAPTNEQIIALAVYRWRRAGGPPADYSHFVIEVMRECWTEAYRAGAAASAERIKALEARVAELEEALAKANTPHWYYSDEEGSPWHSLEEALEQVTDDIRDLYHGDDMPTNHLVQIETARPCPTIWGVVRLLTEDEAEARLTEEPWVFTRCATEAEALAALAKYLGEAQ